MGSSTKQNKTIINRIIQARIDELNADDELPVNHPEKMTRRQRELVIRKIEKLEFSKKAHRRPTPAATAVKASPNNRTLLHRGPGRPRVNFPEVVEITPAEEVKPDPKALEFLDKVKTANG